MKPAFLLAIPQALGKTLGLTILGMAFSAATASAAVDPALLALMPPDAAVLFGLQVHNVLASPFGQYAVGQLPSSNGMVQFAAATGFDYRHDLDEVLGATSAANGTKASLILARGNYQVSKFLALAAVTGSTLTYYNGTQIVSPPKNQTTLAFLNSTTLAIGSTASLQAAIDRYAAHAQFSGPLANKTIAAGATSDVWFATVTPASQFMKRSAGAGPGALPGNVFQQVLEASGGVHFSDAGAVAASEWTTASAQQAQTMLTVLQFLAAMSQSNASPNPNAAQAAALLSSAQLTVNGTALDITIPIPEQTLEQMYAARPKPVKKAAIP